MINCALIHYNDVIMSAMVSQINSLTIVYSTVYSRRRSKKYQSSASLAFVRGIRRWPVNSTHKGPVTRKMFPFDDVIMRLANKTATTKNIWALHCPPFLRESDGHWWIPRIEVTAMQRVCPFVDVIIHTYSWYLSVSEPTKMQDMNPFMESVSFYLL